MSLVVQLTEEIRKFPYFSDFTEDQVEVPDKPFIKELLGQTLCLERLSIEELCTCIETSIYFGLDTKQLIPEFLWKIGAGEKSFGQWFIKTGNKWTLRDGLSVLVKQELNTALGKRVGRKRLIELGMRCITVHYPEIAAGGNLRLLKWADELAGGKMLRNVSTFSAAAKNGHLDCLKYLCEKKCPLDQRAIAGAAEGGHLECLKYLFEQQAGHFVYIAIEKAAKNGRLECLKYLHESSLEYLIFGERWMKSVVIHAARNGHLDCLKYLREKGYYWNEFTSADTAQNGRLECLKYLHEQGCPWNENATIYASATGQLDCLKYLHENGCPWTAQATRAALRNGHENCFKYLLEHGCPVVL